MNLGTTSLEDSSVALFNHQLIFGLKLGIKVVLHVVSIELELELRGLHQY